MVGYIDRLDALVSSDRMQRVEAPDTKFYSGEWVPDPLNVQLRISLSNKREFGYSIMRAGRLGGFPTTEVFHIDKDGLKFQTTSFHVIDEEEGGRRVYDIPTLERVTIADHNLPPKSAQAFRERASDIIGDIERDLKIAPQSIATP